MGRFIFYRAVGVLLDEKVVNFWQPTPAETRPCRLISKACLPSWLLLWGHCPCFVSLCDRCFGVLFTVAAPPVPRLSSTSLLCDSSAVSSSYFLPSPNVPGSASCWWLVFWQNSTGVLASGPLVRFPSTYLPSCALPILAFHLSISSLLFSAPLVGQVPGMR